MKIYEIPVNQLNARLTPATTLADVKKALDRLTSATPVAEMRRQAPEVGGADRIVSGHHRLISALHVSAVAPVQNLSTGEHYLVQKDENGAVVRV